MDSFGLKFKKLRILKKLTQEQLINDFNKKYHYNLTKSAVSQYENDKRFPEINILVNFANYFDVSLDYMLSRNHIRNESVEEKISNYVIDEEKPLKIEDYLSNLDNQIQNSSKVVLYGKIATKKQISIIKTAIKVGLNIAKDY